MNGVYQPEMREQIRKIREEQGLSHEATAQKAGVDILTIAKIEYGLCNPRIDTLEYIAGALGCKLVIRFVKE